MTIDLKDAKPGDLYETANGQTAEFVGKVTGSGPNSANYIFYYRERNRAGNVFVNGKGYTFSASPEEDLIRRKPAKHRITGHLYIPKSRARYPFAMPSGASAQRPDDYEAIVPFDLEYEEGQGL